MSELINTFAVAGLRVPASDKIIIDKFLREKGLVQKMKKLSIGHVVLGVTGIPTELALMSIGLKANGMKPLALPGDNVVYFFFLEEGNGEQEDLLVFAGEVKNAMDEHLGVGKKEVELSEKSSG